MLSRRRPEFSFWKLFALGCLACGFYIGHGLHSETAGIPELGSTAYAAPAGTESSWSAVRIPGSPFQNMYRCNVPGGWLIAGENGGKTTVTYYPDKSHFWNPNASR